MRCSLTPFQPLADNVSGWLKNVNMPKVENNYWTPKKLFNFLFAGMWFFILMLFIEKASLGTGRCAIPAFLFLILWLIVTIRAIRDGYKEEVRKWKEKYFDEED